MGIINNMQKLLSTHQLEKITGPLIISPAKAILSVAQIISGIAVEIFYGVAATIADICYQKDVSQFCDDLSNKGAAFRTKGCKHLLSAVYNIMTFGRNGYKLEEQLGLRYKSVSPLKP